jgi:GNAT superfamily N-acetyltransferase
MESVPFRHAYIDAFLRSAAAEGWITAQAELEFLLKACPDGCLVHLSEGRPVAFITALRYEQSAWIGNLLVMPDFRRQGLGRALMEEVLRRLEASGTETVWLTASADGAGLYRSLGFLQIDRVQRWRGVGTGLSPGTRPAFPEAAVSMDSLGWGDCRRLLFSDLPAGSSLFMAEKAFLVQTAMAGGQHIGPWGGGSPKAAAALLDAAMHGDGPDVGLFLDSPEKNRAAGKILAARGFAVCGSTLLMFKGSVPHYRPEYAYSLASMGSYG